MPNEQKTFPWIGADWLTVSDAARELCISAQMVRVLCDTGKLEHFLILRTKVRAFTAESVARCKQARADAAEQREAQRERFTVRYSTAAMRSE